MVKYFLFNNFQNPQKCYCGSEKCRHYIGKRSEGKKRRKLSKVPSLFASKVCLDEEFNYDPVNKEIVPLLLRPKVLYIFIKVCKVITKKIMKYLNVPWNKTNQYYCKAKDHKLFLNRNIRKMRYTISFIIIILLFNNLFFI